MITWLVRGREFEFDFFPFYEGSDVLGRGHQLMVLLVRDVCPPGINIVKLFPSLLTAH
jgi:hypothetical protein